MIKQLNLILLVLISGQVLAKDRELENLIKATNDNSLAQKAATENVSAAVLEKERSSKHWLPQVYLSGQSFISNDPGTALFGKMSQREIKSSDFMADSLNHPETSVYTKAAIGVNLPLYEGGQKVAMNNAMTFASEAKLSEAKAIRNEFYTEVVKNYVIGKNLKVEKTELIKIKMTLDSIISRYQVGNKENQLGYSGLLGLKSLKNKIFALLNENKSKSSATEKALAELSGTNAILIYPDESSISSLLKEYLSYSENQYVASHKLKSFFQNAKSAQEVIDAEKSRNLPRIGLFGEGYAFNGDRSLGKGYTTGIYLNWNLFSGNDYGASQEAIHKSKAAQYFAEASLQKEKVEYVGLKDALVAINSSLVLLDESEKYLEEQTKISHNLFKNGLINALQYVEVLSRRVDLIKSKSDAETQLIEVHSQLAKNTNDSKSEGANL
ncbi:MAG: TolC family protein [Bacteriovorax sp.]|nr:TolC family protein [Bacteriovorax sp.]